VDSDPACSRCAEALSWKISDRQHWQEAPKNERGHKKEDGGERKSEMG